MRQQSQSVSHYHGSRHQFSIGFILRPQPDGYVHGVKGDALDAGIRRIERLFERYRPPHMISRFEAVFLAPSVLAIAYGGGNDTHVYEVEPIGVCEESCLWWYDNAERYLLDGNRLPSRSAREWAENYWHNVPPPQGRLVTHEYRCRAARVTAVLR